MRTTGDPWPCRSYGPLLPLAPLRRLDLNARLANLVPVRAECGATALLVALEHCATRVVIRVRVQLLEEVVHRRVAARVWIMVGRDWLVGVEDLGRDPVPVLVRLARRRGGARRRGARGERRER